jgi:hypothetical protein
MCCLTRALRRTASELRGLGGGEFEQGRLAFLEGGEVAGLVVWGPVGPAAKEDADPLEGQGADGGVVGRALGSVAVVKSAGPEGVGDGARSPLDEGLPEEGWAGSRLRCVSSSHRDTTSRRRPLAKRWLSELPN